MVPSPSRLWGMPGHTVPCAWDQEIPAWEAKQEQERLLCEAKELQQQQQQQMQQMHQNHMAWLQAQMGCVPPPPPMTQEMIDSHFDPDQVAVENFLEERDEAELDACHRHSSPTM